LKQEEKGQSEKLKRHKQKAVRRHGKITAYLGLGGGTQQQEGGEKTTNILSKMETLQRRGFQRREKGAKEFKNAYQKMRA